MKRIFTLVMGALAMVAVALISAFIAMRLAIHGREAVVPNLSGLSVDDARSVAARQGLSLDLENRFYSADVPAGRILGQDPASGLRVRREWPVRITESLGPQRVTIPDLTGETERAATVGIRRLSLELGVVAHLANAGDPDIVLTQTPQANAGGVDGPRVSLLVSDTDTATASAYVMPMLVGLPYGTASARAASVGLHLVATAESALPTTTTAPASGAGLAQNGVPAAATGRSSSTVTAQSPQAGRRVVQGDVVYVTLGHPAAAAAVVVATQ